MVELQWKNVQGREKIMGCKGVKYINTVGGEVVFWAKL
jgi:hypothetical protein